MRKLKSVAYFKTIMSKLNKKPLGNILQKVSNYATILGSLLTLILGIFTLWLMVKYGENQEMIVKLVNISEKLENQNRMTQKQIDQLKEQTKTLVDLQESNSNQLNLQKKEERSNLIGDYLILSSLHLKLQEYNSIPDERVFIEESYRGKTIQYLHDLKSLVYQGINTRLLKMNDDIFSQWWVFYEQTDFTINSLEEKYLLKTYYGVPLNIKRYYNNSTISKKESDIKTLERFKGYLRTFWIKGATPMMDIKEMKYYYFRYQNLSNFGRIIKE